MLRLCLEIPPSSEKIEQKNFKKQFWKKFSSIPSKLHLSPSTIFGKVLNFIISSYPGIIKLWLPKFRFDIIPLANITEENLGVGRFRPPPPHPPSGTRRANSFITNCGLFWRLHKITQYLIRSFSRVPGEKLLQNNSKQNQLPLVEIDWNTIQNADNL